MQIECSYNNSVRLINIADIYYIESENKTTTIFCEDKKIQTGFRLYQLQEKLAEKGFIQVSKYCILNINKLIEIKPLLNSRMEAIMTNGARVFISRRYLSNIRRRLQQ
jgi:DNA-binding LytR/AlgR family response regulator